MPQRYPGYGRAAHTAPAYREGQGLRARATAPVAHKVELLKTLECLVSHIVVYSGSVDMRELRIECADIAVDAHIIVVQHYQQIVRSVRGIVDTLDGNALLRFNNSLKSLLSKQQNIFEGLNIRSR